MKVPARVSLSPARGSMRVPSSACVLPFLLPSYVVPCFPVGQPLGSSPPCRVHLHVALARAGIYNARPWPQPAPYLPASGWPVECVLGGWVRPQCEVCGLPCPDMMGGCACVGHGGCPALIHRGAMRMLRGGARIVAHIGQCEQPPGELLIAHIWVRHRRCARCDPAPGTVFSAIARRWHTAN